MQTSGRVIIKQYSFSTAEKTTFYELLTLSQSVSGLSESDIADAGQWAKVEAHEKIEELGMVDMKEG